MLRRFLRLSFVLPIVFIVLASCTPGYVNTEDLGQRASEAAIRAHYSGKSLAFPGGPTGVNAEAYYSSDGAFRIVSLLQPTIGVGRWQASTVSGDGRLTIVTTFYTLRDGRVVRWETPETYLVYIQPGGFAIVDELGGGNFRQPVPTPGFQAERRFNELARQMGVR